MSSLKCILVSAVLLITLSETSARPQFLGFFYPSGGFQGGSNAQANAVANSYGGGFGLSNAQATATANSFGGLSNAQATANANNFGAPPAAYQPYQPYYQPGFGAPFYGGGLSNAQGYDAAALDGDFGDYGWY